MQEKEIQDYKKAGEISVKIKEYAREIIKPGTPLLEIAQKIENKILELGGKVAFPVNLSIDDIAAHYHPTLEDKTTASGLLKIDIGIYINGFIADTAFSIDLTEDKKHKELIQASRQALNQALETLKQNPNPSLNDLGNVIQTTIKKQGFSSIINLSGHSLEQYDLHSGITIPNYPNNNTNTLKDGAYAIEPFATTGQGQVYEGNPSGIYILIEQKKPRSPIARKILNYIIKEKKSLPFSLRELQEKFGKMTRIGIRELEKNNTIRGFPQLIEKSHHPVSQAEHTFIKSNNKIIITTQ